MTRKEINLLSMLKSIVQFYNENAMLLSDKPALQAAVEKLKAYIAEVEALEQKQIRGSKADTALKAETKTDLINAMMKVYAGIAAHGAATNDTRLKMAADFSDYELKKMRDSNLVAEAHALYELAVPIAPQLITWHVMQFDIEALDTNSAAFDAKDPAIKNIKARSVQATADMKAKLEEAYDFTKDSLDAMMLPFKIVNPSAYGHYQKAREIIHIAGAHSKKELTDSTKTAK
jgi:hypothetical protein